MRYSSSVCLGNRYLDRASSSVRRGRSCPGHGIVYFYDGESKVNGNGSSFGRDQSRGGRDQSSPGRDERNLGRDQSSPGRDESNLGRGRGSFFQDLELRAPATLLPCWE